MGRLCILSALAEKEPGECHYNPGNMSGKTIDSFWFGSLLLAMEYSCERSFLRSPCAAKSEKDQGDKGEQGAKGEQGPPRAPLQRRLIAPYRDASMREPCALKKRCAASFLPIVTAITAIACPHRHVAVMEGDNSSILHWCPSCGRPMSITRTTPGSPGIRELQTYGCKNCGVWVTEASDARYQRQGQRGRP